MSARRSGLEKVSAFVPGRALRTGRFAVRWGQCRDAPDISGRRTECLFRGGSLVDHPVLEWRKAIPSLPDCSCECVQSSADSTPLYMKNGVKLFSGILFLAGWGLPAFGGVIINEIMHHPASTNVLEEWVELLNTGPTNVNISGWQISSGARFTFPTNTPLAVGAFLVIPADAATFVARYPGVTNVVAGSAGPLAGRTIELKDKTGQNINSVTYSGDGDWAERRMGPATYGHQGWEWYAAHDGLGSSLELINPALPNNYAHNWGSSTILNGTPGRPNSIAAANTAPFISGVTHSPVIPQPTEVVTISARIVDEHTNG